MKSMKLILAFFAMIIFASGINAQADPAAAKKGGGKVITPDVQKPEVRDNRTGKKDPSKPVKVAPADAQKPDMKPAATDEKTGKPGPKVATEPRKVKKTTAPAEKQ
jgi:hypothetical protein